jgi:cytoskeletal protein CcmA (bactofilin family)
MAVNFYSDIYLSANKIGRDADNLLDFSTDNEITFRVSAGDGVVFKASGEIEATSLDISGNVDIDGTLEADAITVNGTTLANYIPTVNANKITVTDSNNDEAFPVVFHDEGGNTLLDDTGVFKYNPNSGTLYTNKLTVTSTSELTSAMTLNAGTPIIFEGATADAHETSLSIVDPTGDRTQYIINASGYIPLLASATTTVISATPAELNILDGVTSTAAELNILDGATVVVAEVNYNDLGGTGTGVAIASKSVVLDANKDFTGANRKFVKTGNTDGTYEGDVVYFGETTSMNAGMIYHLVDGGEGAVTWTQADADAEATCDGLLGVALGTASDSDGVLIKGMVTLNHDPGSLADTLFVSTTAGQATSTAPSGNTDIVRVIGYCLDASNGQIWFNPDNSFIEVSA